MHCEKNLCRVIMLCQMLAILSGVAMLYLLVIVILPSKKELQMELSIKPIMCSTVHMENVNRNTNPDGTPAKCEWASCKEWCLSNDNPVCYQVHVKPRLRGASIIIEDCQEEASEVEELTKDITCSALEVSLMTPMRCKKGECKNLNGLYNCSKEDLNVCRLLTPAYECKSDFSPDTIVCDDKKCKKPLQGVVLCVNGECSTLKDFRHYEECTRRCTDLKLEGYNTMIFSQERLIKQKCSTMTTANGTEQMQTLTDNPDWTDRQSVLMLFCTYIDKTDNGFILDDCFNASLVPQNEVGKINDYRALLQYHYMSGIEGEWMLPTEDDLQVINDTRLYINSQGCVNTLIKECKKFYEEHTKDQKDGRARDRFPCFQTPQSNDFVTAVYNPDQTLKYLILGASVPSSLFIFSCGCLMFCSKIVKPDDEGHLKLKSLNKALPPRPVSPSDL